MNKQRLAILIVAGLGVVATLLPWASISAFGFSASANGLQAGWWGYANLILFAGAGVLGFLGDRSAKVAGNTRTLIVVLGIAAAVLMFILSMKPGMGAFGLWLAILSGIALPIVAVKVKG